VRRQGKQAADRAAEPAGHRGPESLPGRPKAGTGAEDGRAVGVRQSRRPAADARDALGAGTPAGRP
jgi:hypothetical protein